MKHFIHFLLIVTISMVSLVAQTPSEKNQDKSKDLKALVQALGNSDFTVRERADADIRALGPKVSKELLVYLNDDDAERRTRVKAIIESFKAAPAPDEAEAEALKPLKLLESPDSKRNARGTMPKPSDFGSNEEFRKALREFMDEQSLIGKTLSSESLFQGNGNFNFRSSKTIFRNGERLSYSQGDEGIVFSVEPRSGEKSIYKAESLQAFKTAEPEVFERYKGTGIFEEQIIHFDVLRPDSNDQELSDRENAARERVERLLQLTEEDPFADFNQQFSDMIRRHREMNRGLMERLEGLLNRDGVSIDIFNNADRLRRDRTLFQRPSDQPRLGIQVSRPPADIAAKLDPKTLGAAGVYVARVEPGSLAATMGLEAGDVILRLNTTALNEPQDVVDAFAAIEPGGRVAIGLMRDDQSQNLSGRKQGEKKIEASSEPKKLEKLKINEAEVEKF